MSWKGAENDFPTCNYYHEKWYVGVCMCALHVEVRVQLKEAGFLLSYVCRRDGTRVPSLEASTSTH